MVVQHADLFHCTLILELQHGLFLNAQNHNIGAANTNLDRSKDERQSPHCELTHNKVGRIEDNFSSLDELSRSCTVLSCNDASLQTYNAASLSDGFNSIVDLEKVTIR